MSMVNLTGSRPISPPKGDPYDAILRSWSKTGGGPAGEWVFETYAQTLVFAAALGWSEHQRVDNVQTGEPIDWTTWLNVSGFLPVFVSIAVAEEGAIDAVASGKLEGAFSAFEAYAAGGLRIIASSLESSAKTRGDALLDLVEGKLEGRKPVDPITGDLDVTLDALGE